ISRRLALALVNDQLFVLGNESGVRSFLTATRPADGPLQPALRQAAGGAVLALGLNPSRAYIELFTRELPPPLQTFKPLLELKTLTLIAEDRGKRGHLLLDVDYDTADKAKAATDLVRGLVTLGQGLLGAARGVPEATRSQGLTLLKDLQVRNEGKLLRAELTYDQDKLLAAIKAMTDARGRPQP